MAATAGLRVFGLVVGHGEFGDPNPSNRPHLGDGWIANRACVHVVGCRGAGKVLKAGPAAHHIVGRQGCHKGELMFVGGDYGFIKVFDFDNVPAEYNAAAEQNYEDLVEGLINSPKLSNSQHLLSKALYEYKGDGLGPKRSIMLGMVEYGVQKKYGLPAPVEFLMFDEKVYNHVYKLVESDANYLYDVLSFLFEDDDDSDGDDDELGVNGVAYKTF